MLIAVALLAGLLGGLVHSSHTTSHILPRSAVVDLGYGQYQGVSLYNSVDEYLGIRYAKAPLDNLRFRAPQYPENSSAIQDASSFGPICIGVGQSTGDDSLSEDCLFINVWRPNNASSNASLPVWMFIQGGGYADLSNANYNGSEVVKQSGHDIVFVNFNYRVGVLGFLASEDVRQDGDLNAGLLDQRMAMKWVNQYIHLFGGNPNHVVIHGDSAGAGSVALHLTAYGANNTGLFVGAVAESTFWPTQRTVAEMEFQYKQFVEDVGCEKETHKLTCLRGTDLNVIQKYNVQKPFPGGSDSPLPLWYFLPVVDGDLVPDQLYNLFDQGKFIHVPMIVSDDNNEGTDFAYNAANEAEVAQFMKNNYPGLNETDLANITQTYPLMDALPEHEAYFPSAAAAYGEATFTCPGNQMASSIQNFSSNRVWNYRFNIQDPTEISKGMGVPHVFELPAIFGVGDTNEPTYSYADSNANIIPITMDYYLSFIKCLNPNTFRNEKAPEWKSWGSGRGQRLKLQTNSTAMEEVPEAQTKRCLLWQQLSASMEH
ncbi:Carboxylesterase type B [Penicillium taxi]|uniref:Carboxylesterase type B n=1 Tax=Penicillium taxi TaxID=168475 RepID=UPI00254598D7|nr:Carboxylesterase type B [Penicillium taxi]KAJ5885485.1 Carboxylesterase type B [Penicillium taxi]